MHTIDWIILIMTISFIVVYGTLKTKKSKNIKDYILANNEVPWWTVCLSIMGTQASAITFLSTPGQAFHDGMGFIQFYFGLPLAMIIICITFIPIYHKLQVYTAYEFLEQRFDLKTRTLASLLFLVQRGLSTGITIYAPAIIISSILKWDLTILNIIIGILVIVYTVTGGTNAVNATQKYQMLIIILGMFVCFYLVMDQLPEGITFTNAMHIAGANNKMAIVDFSWDTKNRYTFWSGITGGLFLSLSYFGTDQSQVQRYLSGKSTKESQLGLIFNGLLKVPMQFFILLIGVMVFVFFQFQSAPLNFNPNVEKAIENSIFQKEYFTLKNDLEKIAFQKKETSTKYIQALQNDQNVLTIRTQITNLETKEKNLRNQAKDLAKQADKTVETNDKDYIFIYFILHYLPKGFIGLLLAVILSAAMSATASGLSALASTTCVDLYKRNVKTEKPDSHYVNATKLFTLFWGIIAILFACFASLFENLIQFVNIIGSIFYGTILGIFLIAFYFKVIQAKAVFPGAVLSQLIIFYIFWLDIVSFLWLNFIGTFLTISIAMAYQKFNTRGTKKTT